MSVYFLWIAPLLGLRLYFVFKVFSMLTWYYCLLFISCAASVPVHNGKGIRLTPNEKIQPSRGRFHWFASPPLLSQPLSFCTFWFSPRVAQVGRSTLNPTSNSNIPFLILTLHYQSKFFFYFIGPNVSSFIYLGSGSGVDKSIGEVSVQIELHTHPGNGERKVTVKGLFESS